MFLLVEGDRAKEAQTNKKWRDPDRSLGGPEICVKGTRYLELADIAPGIKRPTFFAKRERQTAFALTEWKTNLYIYYYPPSTLMLWTRPDCCSVLNSAQQLRQGHPKTFRQDFERSQARFLLPGFEIRQMRPTDPCVCGHIILVPTPAFP
jgi:hypothetical protein